MVLDYSKGKIYKIWSPSQDIQYIGSTTQELSRRLGNHKKNFKLHYSKDSKYNHYYTSYEVLKCEDCRIDLLESYSCNNKTELLQKEGHYISSNICVNKIIAGRSRKQYRIDNKQKIAKRMKDYQEINKEKIANQNKHFTEPGELREFYEDGVEIIREFTKNKGKYFSKRGWHLVGIELPLILNPHMKYPNIMFQAYLDVVLYHEPTNSLKIIDIKTSKQGWSKKEKANEQKQYQLIAYKKYFSEIYNIPLDNIEIEFMIVKRKPFQSEDFVIKRIQIFKPASGKVKLNKVSKSIENFVESAFDRNGFKEVEHQPKINDN